LQSGSEPEIPWPCCSFSESFDGVRLGSRIVLLSPHPGRVHSEFDPAGCETGRELEAKIEKILFSDGFTGGGGV
jgi:hypothetical protein